MVINMSIVLAYYLTHPGISNQIKDRTLAGLPNHASVGFFFFFFYSYLTPHSPTGMAGGPIRTQTRGANYVQTQRK